MKQKKLDKILFLFGIMIASFGIYSLYNENHFKNSVLEKQESLKNSIAFIKESSGISKTKRANDLLWRKVSSNQYIADNQTIYTQNDSNVEINLWEGGTIKLGPNSLIVLSQSKGVPTIKFVKGSISGNISKSVKVTYKDKSVKLDSGKKESSFSLKVEDKAVVMTTKKNDEEEKVKLGESIEATVEFEALPNVDKDETVEVLEVEPLPKKPVELAEIVPIVVKTKKIKSKKIKNKPLQPAEVKIEKIILKDKYEAVVGFSYSQLEQSSKRFQDRLSFTAKKVAANLELKRHLYSFTNNYSLFFKLKVSPSFFTLDEGQANFFKKEFELFMNQEFDSFVLTLGYGIEDLLYFYSSGTGTKLESSNEAYIRLAATSKVSFYGKNNYGFFEYKRYSFSDSETFDSSLGFLRKDIQILGSSFSILTAINYKSILFFATLGNESLELRSKEVGLILSLSNRF